MKTTKSITQKQHKHSKSKERFNRRLDFGTPQVSLRKQKHQQRHELLSDWSDAS